MFVYTISLLRAISIYYKNIYDGIEVISRGSYYTITNPFDIAEFKVDFERGCEYLKLKAGKDYINYHDIKKICNYLNGVK